MNKKDNYKAIINGFLLTAISLCLLVFMESLFFITKPSFLTALSDQQIFITLTIGSFSFITTWLAASSIYFIILLIISKFRDLHNSWLPAVPASITLSILFLLLFDNFTNTMFGLSISKSTGGLQILYIIGFIMIAASTIKKVFNTIKSTQPAKFSLIFTGCIAPVLISIIFLYFSNPELFNTQTATDTNTHSLKTLQTTKDSNSPNIIFFATDGINSSMLSAYGNHNLTTPNLDALLEKAMVFNNAFTNSERTTGSITSMLTGRYPLTTKVLFPPHILQGKDSLLHLPKILKDKGYKSFQQSVRYYADAADLNMSHSFDTSNDKKAPLKDKETTKHSGFLLEKAITNRITDRFQHIFFVKNMGDVYSSLHKRNSVYGIPDDFRISKAIEFINQTDQPFFIHLHLMDTHCCGFSHADGHFSDSITDARYKKQARLLDLLRSSDILFGKMIEALKKSGKYDNTIIVYSSDHNVSWGFKKPVPLIFISPTFKKAENINKNVQLIDIAPTILTLLNIEKPNWMEGVSLINNEYDEGRIIYTVTQLNRKHFRAEHGDSLSKVIGGGFPGYGLNVMGAIHCNQWYSYDIKNETIASGNIGNAYPPCETTTPISEEAMKLSILQHFQERDVFSKEEQ